MRDADTAGPRVATVTLLVRDYDEAIAWYRDTLGLDLIADSAIDAGKRWVVVGGKGGARLLLAKAVGERQQAAIGDQSGGRVFMFLETRDFERDHRRMLDLGVRFREAPRQEAYGRVAVFEDLYGNAWDLLEAKPPEDGATTV